MTHTISLTSMEDSLIARLHSRCCSEDSDSSIVLHYVLQEIRILLTEIAEMSPQQIYLGQFVMLGLVYRTHELLLGGVDQLLLGRNHVWAGCFRGLIETFGSLAFVSEKPDRLICLVNGHGITPGKLRTCAIRRIPEYKRIFGWLDSIVHPGVKSFYQGMKITDAEEHLAVFAIPPPSPSAKEIVQGVDGLTRIYQLISEETRAFLVNHRKHLISGQPIMAVKARGGE